MKTVGIIAEYNPFHNGHAYHIDKARKMSEADHVIVVMSGDFVQRGEPAIVNKYTRTHMALLSGADLVLELPVRYATGSAEYFACGAVSLLSSLGIVDVLCFGSECGDIQPIDRIGQILSTESPEFSSRLKYYASQGLLYPAAREKALLDCFENQIDLSILSSPNNILGIEYCKAIHRQNAHMIPMTIQRKGADYHSCKLAESFSSASAIRHEIESEHSTDLSGQIPKASWDIFHNAIIKNKTIHLNDLTLLLKYKLMHETPDSLESYLDVTADLANKIYMHRYKFDAMTSFIQRLKSKDLAYTRISRALIHILLNIKKQSETDCLVPYARILGFRKNSSELLKKIKEKSSIPLISKLADKANYLSGDALVMLDEDIWCANLYETVSSAKSNSAFLHELSHKIVITP